MNTLTMWLLSLLTTLAFASYVTAERLRLVRTK